MSLYLQDPSMNLITQCVPHGSLVAGLGLVLCVPHGSLVAGLGLVLVTAGSHQHCLLAACCSEGHHFSTATNEDVAECLSVIIHSHVNDDVTTVWTPSLESLLAVACCACRSFCVEYVD